MDWERRIGDGGCPRASAVDKPKSDASGSYLIGAHSTAVTIKLDDLVIPFTYYRVGHGGVIEAVLATPQPMYDKYAAVGTHASVLAFTAWVRAADAGNFTLDHEQVQGDLKRNVHKASELYAFTQTLTVNDAVGKNQLQLGQLIDMPAKFNLTSECQALFQFPPQVHSTGTLYAYGQLAMCAARAAIDNVASGINGANWQFLPQAGKFRIDIRVVPLAGAAVAVNVAPGAGWVNTILKAEEGRRRLGQAYMYCSAGTISDDDIYALALALEVSAGNARMVGNDAAGEEHMFAPLLFRQHSPQRIRRLVIVNTAKYEDLGGGQAGPNPRRMPALAGAQVPGPERLKNAYVRIAAHLHQYDDFTDGLSTLPHMLTRFTVDGARVPAVMPVLSDGVAAFVGGRAGKAGIGVPATAVHPGYSTGVITIPALRDELGLSHVASCKYAKAPPKTPDIVLYESLGPHQIMRAAMMTGAYMLYATQVVLDAMSVTPAVLDAVRLGVQPANLVQPAPLYGMAVELLAENDEHIESRLDRGVRAAMKNFFGFNIAENTFRLLGLQRHGIVAPLAAMEDITRSVGLEFIVDVTDLLPHMQAVPKSCPALLLGTAYSMTGLVSEIRLHLHYEFHNVPELQYKRNVMRRQTESAGVALAVGSNPAASVLRYEARLTEFRKQYAFANPVLVPVERDPLYTGIQSGQLPTFDHITGLTYAYEVIVHEIDIDSNTESVRDNGTYTGLQLKPRGQHGGYGLTGQSIVNAAAALDELFGSDEPATSKSQLELKRDRTEQDYKDAALAAALKKPNQAATAPRKDRTSMEAEGEPWPSTLSEEALEAAAAHNASEVAAAETHLVQPSTNMAEHVLRDKAAKAAGGGVNPRDDGA